MHDQVQQVPYHEPAESMLLLEGVEPLFEGERIDIAPGLSVTRLDQQFVQLLEQRGLENARELVGDKHVYIHSIGTTSTDDLLRPDAFATALLLATDLALVPEVHIISTLPNHNQQPVVSGTAIPGLGTVRWGHYRNTLTSDDVEEAKDLWAGIAKVELTEHFDRVGNAILFYKNGYNTDNPDLALVAFTTCLETLFSTFEQEISFRLSLRLAHFLGDSHASRRQFFEDCREVYKVRSKIVHGSPIYRRSLESSAIYLVETVVPQAELLARQALKKLLQSGLERVFRNSKRINSLFDELLFCDSLEQALAKIGEEHPAN